MLSRLCVAAALGGVLASSPAEARVGCAAGGPPLYDDPAGRLPTGAIVPSGLVSLWAIPWAGANARRTSGDPIDGAGLDLARLRLGVCGGAESLAYRLVYEPWDALERAQSDRTEWGRIIDAQVAWLPYRWASIALGIGKVPLSHGREQPEGALPLVTLPYATLALTPDRRFGLTADVHLGVLRLAAGAYQGGRLPDVDALGGLLLAARAALEPWGPVGRRSSSEHGEWTPRFRPATGLSGGYLIKQGSPTGFAVGADVSMAWRRLYLGGEFLYVDRWPLERTTSSLESRGRRLGAYVEGVFQAWRPYLAVAVRAEVVDENLNLAGRGRYIAATGGATGHLLGESIQLQVMYTRKFHLVDTFADDAVVLALTAAH